MSIDNIKPNVFTEYELTLEEQQLGSVFSGNQLAVLKNLLANAVQQRLRLDFTPTDVIGFAQNEALIKGQISILEFLIDTHESTMAELAANSQQY